MIFIKKKGSTFGKKSSKRPLKGPCFSRFMKKARQVAGVLQGKGLSGAVLWPLYAPAGLCEHGQRGAVRLAEPPAISGTADAEQGAVLQAVPADVPPAAGNGGGVRRRMDGRQQWDRCCETGSAQQRHQRRRGSTAQQPGQTGH